MSLGASHDVVQYGRWGFFATVDGCEYAECGLRKDLAGRARCYQNMSVKDMSLEL